MNYKILYDKPGRLRLRLGQAAFTREEGYGIEKLLYGLEGVLSVSTTPINGGLLITYEEENRENILNVIEGLSKTSLPVAAPGELSIDRELYETFAKKVVDILAKNIVIKNLFPNPIRNMMTIYRSIKYLRNGMNSLSSGAINVDVLDATAIGVSIGQGNYSTANSIMLLLSIAAMLEDYTTKKVKNALIHSLAIKTDKVWRMEDDTEVSRQLSEIRAGDIIVVRTGSIIPVDGIVISGEALVNESSLTGESTAVMKSSSATVYAGSVVEEGSINIEVKAIDGDTHVHKIVELIEQSEDIKAQVQSRAEKLADSIVPYSFLASIGIFMVTGNVSKALSILMVDYSCAIKLSTHISVISAMHEASSNNIMVKGGKYLEAFAEADTIVFDKTGTLTTATPKVAQIIPFRDYTEEYVLRTAACIEEHFPHSVARAIVKKAEEEDLHHNEEHAEVEYVVAHGIATRLEGKHTIIGSYHFVVEDEGVKITKKQKEIIQNTCKGYSIIYLAKGKTLAGAICIEDPPREEAKDVINSLRKLGVDNILMLTGDSENAAEAVAKELGITDYRSEVLPVEKSIIIQEYKDKGHRVIMIGDGVNDSPALSISDASVSMKDSSDIAREVSDVVLLSNDLKKIITLRHISRGLIYKINRNYQLIVGFNSTLILLGLLGAITPTTSALLHNLSTMFLGVNSMKPLLKK
ncbi:MAG: heavy metal translocating P-type ATPase [Thermotaleaceae bacterium]